MDFMDSEPIELRRLAAAAAAPAPSVDRRISHFRPVLARSARHCFKSLQVATV
jgi:hypothetical protein